MIKFSIMYPQQADKNFDFEYYQGKHIPATIEVLRNHPDFNGVFVERGLSGVSKDSEAAFVAACHITFTTQKGFLEAFMPHAAELQADVPNYTDIEPVVQFSKIEICESKD